MTPETNASRPASASRSAPTTPPIANALLNHADTALYRAKTDGRNTYRFFEASMGAAVRERRLLEHDLRHGDRAQRIAAGLSAAEDIAERQDRAASKRCCAGSTRSAAKSRPAVFIPIAEESGAILEIGDWVLETACREAATWEQPLTVAVNVSAVQLYNPDFVQELHQDPARDRPAAASGSKSRSRKPRWCATSTAR